MAKKFGKFFMATATVSALAAGAYYLLRKKDAQMDDAFDDEDELDNFDEDLDDETSADKAEERKYVDLDLTKAADAAAEKVSEKAEEFKEGLDAVKAEASDKIVGAADEAETKVEEFFNDENS